VAPATTAAATATAGGVWDTLALQCDDVLPAALKDKLGLTGMQLSPSGGHGSLTCGFVDPKTARQRTFMYECKGRPAEKQMVTIKIQEETFRNMAKDAKLLPGVGRFAIEGTAMGVSQAWVLDDKTPCKVTMTLGFEKTLPTDDYVHAVLDAFHAAAPK
jgi:hypothetical protein